MPTIDQLLIALGYDDDPSCLRPSDVGFQAAPQVGHILRKAADELNLEAAYVIHPSPEKLSSTAPIPAVYICSAENAAEADEIHRKVWNQDIAPFVLVNAPEGVRLYSGFQHREMASGKIEGQLTDFLPLDDVGRVLKDFNAASFRNGTVWRDQAEDVLWRHRLNRRLLENLVQVDKILQENGLSHSKSHALIGRYVYLRYLRDRKILSDRKLARWQIDPEAIFGRNAKIDAVVSVNDQLDQWLNGSVFPISFSKKGGPKAADLQLVAGVFNGDQVLENGDTQLALDFDSYDFSYIPIETLSLVYEQFLHKGRKSEARGKGAYYTPIPVVNLMLAEVEETRPIRRGMKAIDPSCGSGAFLVQAYRLLIEREFPADGDKPKPGDLRELLVDSIFGIDVDEDACNVTELSLVLTLLDYLTPPDLEGHGRKFKLPTLRGKNIFHGNFFDPFPGPLQKHADEGGFDWVVGNPPWKQLSKKKLTDSDKPVWKWIAENEKERPVGSNQMARAFVWKSAELLKSESGKAALFIPAMTLYDNPSEKFRIPFFANYDVSTVVDFSNLAPVLAPGRFQYPSAAVFFEGFHIENDEDLRDKQIAFYAPKVANQELTRPPKKKKLSKKTVRTESWEILVNGNEIRHVSANRAASGDGMIWKLAMWGSHLDERLLRRIEKRFTSFGKVEREGKLFATQGLELREAEEAEKVEAISEVVGKQTFDPKKLKGLRSLFVLPKNCQSKVPPEEGFVRKGRGQLPFLVSKPPHVIVSAARNFAIYSEKFVVVPPRQVGVISPSKNRDFLKALSLYLSSDFALYHQFLSATEFGIKRPRANLETLRKIPIPFSESDDLSEWVKIHVKLVEEQKKGTPKQQGELFETGEELNFTSKEFKESVVKLNRLTAKSLGLSKQEEALVHDLIQVRFGLLEGKIENRAVQAPTKPELLKYAKELKAGLDYFLGPESVHSHEITVLAGSDSSGVVKIEYCKRPAKKTKASVEKSNAALDSGIGKIDRELLSQKSQWVYFNRNFRIYDGDRTFCFKPMQRFHWTQTQAVLDAQNIIAEILTSQEK